MIACENIHVGCSPTGPGDKFDFRSVRMMKLYDVVINVSDSPCATLEISSSVEFSLMATSSYWFPIHEVWHWGYAPFYGAAKVIDFHLERYSHLAEASFARFLIHCHAGVNRSVSVAYAILKAEGYPDDELLIHRALGLKPEPGERASRQFDSNVRKGYIPYDIIDFLKARKEYPSYSIMGLLEKIGSRNLYLNKGNVEN